MIQNDYEKLYQIAISNRCEDMFRGYVGTLGEMQAEVLQELRMGRDLTQTAATLRRMGWSVTHKTTGRTGWSLIPGSE